MFDYKKELERKREKVGKITNHYADGSGSSGGCGGGGSSNLVHVVESSFEVSHLEEEGEEAFE
mgnify:CR=1 FL=1